MTPHGHEDVFIVDSEYVTARWHAHSAAVSPSIIQMISNLFTRHVLLVKLCLR